MYFMTGTLRDLALLAGRLSHQNKAPIQKHWTAVKRIVKYMKSTLRLGVYLFGLEALSTLGGSDSDLAEDFNDWK